MIKMLMKQIKTILTFYYFNSFIAEQKLENNNLYTKEKFKEDVYDIFQKKYNLILTSNTISKEEMFPKIVKILIEIQISGKNNISTFNIFNLEIFKSCLEVSIEVGNTKNIKIQIEDTINLLNISNLSKE